MRSINVIYGASEPTTISASTLKVNVSPLMRSHCLFIPYIEKCLPQVLDAPEPLFDALSLFMPGVKSMIPDPEDIWIGFNSTGAHSSVNHLHFHVALKSQLVAEGQTELMIERGVDVEIDKDEDGSNELRHGIVVQKTPIGTDTLLLRLTKPISEM